MKILPLLLCLAALLLGQQQPMGEERPGDFNIRFDPQAELQTEAQIPFQITITDSLNKPVVQAKVTLQIETTNHQHVKVYKATMLNNGVYMAMPVFPVPGDYNVYVEARRMNGRYMEMSARTKQYSIPRSAPQ